MTDKLLEKKKKEFKKEFPNLMMWVRESEKVSSEYNIQEVVWDFIEKLIEEVEESLSQNSDFLLKATRDLEQKSCNHMTNLEYYDGTIQCTRCYKFLTGKEYIKVLNNCGIGN